MKENHAKPNLNAIFHALADDTRRDILSRLSRESLPIATLADAYNMTLAAVSKHVRVLEDASLISVTKVGRTRHCTITPEPLAAAVEQIEFYRQFWSQQLDALQQAAERLARNNLKPQRRLK